MCYDSELFWKENLKFGACVVNAARQVVIQLRYRFYAKLFTVLMTLAVCLHSPRPVFIQSAACFNVRLANQWKGAYTTIAEQMLDFL